MNSNEVEQSVAHALLLRCDVAGDERKGECAVVVCLCCCPLFICRVVVACLRSACNEQYAYYDAVA